jgi:carboxylesterase
MKVVQPKPFTFERGPRAVLLLHGFTGHSADVRMLGRFLEKKNYTCHAPIYRGHGVAPEELIKTNPDQWWEDVEEAFNDLKERGYEEIAVAGLSLGGVFGLKLAYTRPVKAIIPMCTPMFFDNEDQLTEGFKQFTKQYKRLEGKSKEEIEEETDAVMEESGSIFNQVADYIADVKSNVDTIYTPAMVVQAGKDQMINPDSANYIYDNLESDQKELKWYEESGHVITIGKEKDQLYEDIYQFLESLDWKSS